MNFIEAMQALKMGKMIRRKAWADECYFWKKDGIDNHYFQICEKDIEADDWEIFKSPIPVSLGDTCYSIDIYGNVVKYQINGITNTEKKGIYRITLIKPFSYDMFSIEIKEKQDIIQYCKQDTSFFSTNDIDFKLIFLKKEDAVKHVKEMQEKINNLKI